MLIQSTLKKYLDLESLWVGEGKLGKGVLKHLLCNYKFVYIMKVNPTKF